jgi:hypothetical protein
MQVRQSKAEQVARARTSVTAVFEGEAAFALRLKDSQASITAAEKTATGIAAAWAAASTFKG